MKASRSTSSLNAVALFATWLPTVPVGFPSALPNVSYEVTTTYFLIDQRGDQTTGHLYAGKDYSQVPKSGTEASKAVGKLISQTWATRQTLHRLDTPSAIHKQSILSVPPSANTGP